MKSERARLKKKAWAAFSRYIRVRDAGIDGRCKCVTCGVSLPWKEMQAGHFIDSRCNAVLFHEPIVYAQCPSCNVWKKGNKVAYTLFMLKKHTKEEIEKFCNLKHKVLKLDIEDLEEILDMYTQKAEYIMQEKELT